MLYIIPTTEVFCDIGQLNHYRTLMTLDSISVFIGHDKDQDLTDINFIRRHLIGLNGEQNCIVKADSPKQALEKLFSEWSGFTAAENIKPARQISKKSPIIEYTNCSDIVEMKSGYFGCKKGEDNGRLSPNKKSYCGCVLDKFEPPTNCPIKNQDKLRYTKSVIEIVDGYTFKRHSFNSNGKALTDDLTKELLVEHYKESIINIAKNSSVENIIDDLNKNTRKLKAVLSDE